MKHLKTPAVQWSDAPSGFRQLVGYRASDWSDGAATVELTIGPRHLNRGGLLHGGVITTLIDAAGGYAGCYCALKGHVRRSVTVSLSAQFISPARSGTIKAHARARGGGTRLFISTVEVVDGDGKLIALGEGVYRYRAGSETAEGVALESNGERRETELG